MDIVRLAKYFMPGKIKLIIAVIFFLVLPAILVDAVGIHIIWFFGGLIMIPLSDFINPMNYILLIVEAYVLACILINHFSPSIEKKVQNAPYDLRRNFV